MANKHCLTFVALLLAGLSGTHLGAQQDRDAGGSGVQSIEAPATELQALDVSSADVMRLLSQLHHQGPQMIYVPASQQVIVRATKAELAQLKESLQSIEKAIGREVLESLELEHLEPSVAISTVMKLRPESTARLTADPQRNAILAAGSHQEINAVKAVLSLIDTPGAAAEEKVVKLFALRFVEAQSALDTVGQVLGSRALRLAADPRSNSLVASGTDRDLQVLEALLVNAIDLPAKPSPSQDGALSKEIYEIHLTWLRASEEGGQELTTEWRQIAEQIHQSNGGFANPGVAANFRVAVGLDGRFQLASGDVADDWQSQISGRISAGSDDRLELQIELQLSRLQLSRPQEADRTGRPRATNQQTSVSTQISTKLDHTTVLGIAPTSTAPSAFLVRVTKQETPKP